MNRTLKRRYLDPDVYCHMLLTRAPRASDRDTCTPRCPVCDKPIYKVMLRTGPAFLCHCQKGHR